MFDSFRITFLMRILVGQWPRYFWFIFILGPLLILLRRMVHLSTVPHLSMWGPWAQGHVGAPITVGEARWAEAPEAGGLGAALGPQKPTVLRWSEMHSEQFRGVILC